MWKGMTQQATQVRTYQTAKSIQKSLQDADRAIGILNRYSSAWAIVFTLITLIAGIANLPLLLPIYTTGAAYPAIVTLLITPLGFFAAWQDAHKFQGAITARNYASRGIDMILVGAIGCAAGSAGLLIFLKGCVVLWYTSTNHDEFEKFSNTQWEDCVAREMGNCGSPLVGLATIAAFSEFALTTSPLGWTIAKILLGTLVYLAYEKFAKLDITQDRLTSAGTKCIVLGVLGCIVNGAGLLILFQGILLTAQHNIPGSAATRSPATQTAQVEVRSRAVPKAPIPPPPAPSAPMDDQLAFLDAITINGECTITGTQARFEFTIDNHSPENITACLLQVNLLPGMENVKGATPDFSPQTNSFHISYIPSHGHFIANATFNFDIHARGGFIGSTLTFKDPRGHAYSIPTKPLRVGG